MTTADNFPDSSGAPGAAPGAELSIPKHRFDEINQELKKVREEQATERRLFMDQLQRQQQPQARPQGRATPTPEELGIDPQIAKAIEAMTEAKLENARQEIGQYIGATKNEAEIAVLLATHGADKAKHLDEIKRIRTKQWNETGTYMSPEVALKMVLADETALRERAKDARIAALEAQIAGKQPAATAGDPQGQAPQTPPAYQAPGAAGTRQVPTGGVPPSSIPTSAKSFAELSVEEMEARLEQQFGSGARI